MKRWSTLVGLAVGAACLAVTCPVLAQSHDAARKPNIIVIVADDLGYADLACQGCKDIPTPHIDSLATGGVRFTNGYVSCAVCSPTRAGLMTGRYQTRFGHEFNPGGARELPATIGLPLSETTLADRLKAAGYVTGMVGKWHLGMAPQFHPLRRGFAEYYGFLHGSHSYIDAKADPNNLILRGTEPVDEKEYLTDAFTREAVAFIDRHRKEPFFLYLTFNSVHTPMQAPQKYLDRFTRIDEPKRRTLAAMLSAMDDGIGAVLDKVRQAGLEGNTLVFFVSDNGGPTNSNGSRNDPLRGFKSQLLEGGIRVPFLVQWKGRLPEGKVYDRPVIALDILPTAMAAAGEPITDSRKLDGVNLIPFLTGKNDQPPHEALYWRFGRSSAIRKGDWKLLKVESEPLQVFNLAADIGEKNNLAEKDPDKLKELTADLAKWEAQLAQPLWRGRR